MRLEHAPGCTVLHLFCRRQCRLDFCGVVRIIINDNNAVFFAFFLEAAFCARKMQKPLLAIRRTDTYKMCRRNGCHRICDIMVSGYIQMEIPE